MLPRFETVHRARPVAVVAEERRTGFVAPFAAVEAELGTHDVAGRLACELVAPGGIRLSGWYDGGRRLAGLDVTDASGRTTHHRSRGHGQPETPPDSLAVALTGKVGELDAPYPTNIPWPTLVERPDGWLLLTFDGTAYGGELPGYGTHGGLIVMRAETGRPGWPIRRASGRQRRRAAPSPRTRGSGGGHRGCGSIRSCPLWPSA